MSTSETADPVARLERADADRRAAEEAVQSVGEADLRSLREACSDLRDLLRRYEGRATGDGDFKAFIEFQEEIAHFIEGLPEDLPERDAFEAIDDLLQQRRLTEDDFAAVRERLDAAETTARPLEDRADAEERYRQARRDVRDRKRDVEERIGDLQRLLELGAADLDAPVERIREPIQAYDEAVRAAFREYRGEAPAREFLSLIETAALYPLVPFPTVPEDLLEYAENHEAGTEPITTLREYAEYSRSKLDHYVDDPAALSRAVGTRKTFLERLDADPLTVGWPPPPAETLRWQCEERVSVVARFAPDLVADLRAVRDLTRREDYDRLRASAVARDELDTAEREQLRSGAVERDLESAREERERLADALEQYPER